MSVTLSARSTTFVRALVAAALCLPACDKITGGDKEPAKSDDGGAKASTEDDAKKKAEDEEAKKKAATEDEAKKKAATEDEAKKKALADEEAKKKAAEEEAKKKAEEDAKKAVLLSDITIAAAGGMFGGSAGALKVDATAKFNEAINTGTYVHMKALCKKDARIFSDVAQVGLVDYSKQLHQFAAGETTKLSGTIFTQGIDAVMSPCQFDFRLGASYGGVSVPLTTQCFDGTAAKAGPCDPPIAAAAMSGSSLPIEVADLTVKADTSYGGAPGININEVLQINSAINENAQLVIKSACMNGTQKLVDTQFPYLSAGPFKYEPGESLSRPVRMYWNPAFAFAEAPKQCDITFMLRQQKTGSWTEYDETVLKKGCFKDEKVTDGACDPAAPAAPADAPLTAASATIDGVKLELAAPYGAGPNQFNLKVQYDVTIKAPVDGSGMIESHVTCKVGSASRLEKIWLSGVELHYLDVGETTRMTGQGFGSEPLAGNPKSCEISFTVGNRMGAAPATPIELGKYCLKKGKLKAGKC